MDGFIGLIALIVVYRLTKAGWRLCGRALEIFGETAQARVISLGAASLVYPRVVSSIVSAALGFFTQLFSDLPTQLTRR